MSRSTIHSRAVGAGLQALLLAAAGLAVPAVRAADVSAPPFALSDPARIEAGKSRFGATCAAYCHGSGGVGGRAPSFKGRSDFVPAAAFQTITEGRRGADIMPPWGKAFTPEQIWELVAYLDWLSRQAADQ